MENDKQESHHYIDQETQDNKDNQNDLKPRDRENTGGKKNNIEVIYADTTKQYIINLMVPRDCSVLKAIELSGILKLLSHIDLEALKILAEKGGVGIYGKSVKLNTLVKEHDRIEIYRPLLRNPKNARREKAKNFKKTKS